MMTSATIEELHALRKKVCTCERQHMIPTFHKLDCPYLQQGEEYLRMVLGNEVGAAKGEEG